MKIGLLMLGLLTVLSNAVAAETDDTAKVREAVRIMRFRLLSITTLSSVAYRYRV